MLNIMHAFITNTYDTYTNQCIFLLQCDSEGDDDKASKTLIYTFVAHVTLCTNKLIKPISVPKLREVKTTLGINVYVM